MLFISNNKHRYENLQNSSEKVEFIQNIENNPDPKDTLSLAS